MTDCMKLQTMNIQATSTNVELHEGYEIKDENYTEYDMFDTHIEITTLQNEESDAVNHIKPECYMKDEEDFIECFEEIEENVCAEGLYDSDVDVETTVLTTENYEEDIKLEHDEDIKLDYEENELDVKNIELVSDNEDDLEQGKYKPVFKSNKLMNYPKGTKCLVCNKSYKKRCHLLRHVVTHYQKINECHICHKTFTRRDILLRHVKIHKPIADREVYQCEICQKRCNSEEAIGKHLRMHKTKLKHNEAVTTIKYTELEEYNCKICDKVFESKVNVMRHLFIHTGEKKYRCDECGKTFIQKCDMKKHKQVHRNERKYQCQVCDKAFNRSAVLIKHAASHTNTKQFTCPTCHKHFAYSWCLQLHYKKLGFCPLKQSI